MSLNENAKGVFQVSLDQDIITGKGLEVKLRSVVERFCLDVAHAM